jgi:hypothetical protein
MTLSVATAPISNKGDSTAGDDGNSTYVVMASVRTSATRAA